MKVWILHYHLHPGGVTQVIQSQVKALFQLQYDIETTVVAGYAENIDWHKQYDTEILINEDFNYLNSNQNYTKNHLTSELNKMYSWFKGHIEKGDIIHFHNLTLGKNPLVTIVGYLLVKEGYHVINHCHDFAEDRPQNWKFLQKIISETLEFDLISVLYPPLPNYHIAVLNTFDQKRLEKYNIPDGRIHVFPNPVDIQTGYVGISKEDAHQKICRQLSLDPSLPLITYPVRAIRRKNIGELILISILFKENYHFLVTQPPKNPVEIEFYEQWKSFCNEYEINIHFEVGNKVDYKTLINASEYCITTSYREGFGMVFLEPWLLNTPVIGRNIPYVTKDFINAGMYFPLLYDQLTIETGAGYKDFIQIDDDEQRKFIISLLKNDKKRDRIIIFNAYLHKLTKKVTNDMIIENQHIIQNNYSIEKFSERLYEVYKRIA
ncbi:MAG: glycosyltransferase family 4 protein [Bacteroidota bacterium]